MYGGPERSVNTVQRYVAKRRDGRPVRDGWLFDAFVELTFNAPSGECTDYGKTTSSDWLALLDRWFGGPANAKPRGEVGQLDDAVEATAAESADDGKPMGPPPTRRQLVIMLPWPSIDQHSFGTIDGRPADLGKPDDRLRVVTWYARQVKQRFAALNPRHLDLWGLYFMREDAVGPDGEWMAGAVDAIHAEQLRTLWIPYWNAPGVDKARERGVDVTVLQPSAAFTSPIDGGRVSASRLRAASVTAAQHGAGIEIEARGGGTSLAEKRMLRQYLAAGTRFGYQHAASAWFLGWKPTPFDPLPDGSDNPVYQDVADYIRGLPAADDDIHPEWQFTHEGDEKTVAAATFAPRDDVRAVRIELVDTPTNKNGDSFAWQGRVQVETHTASGWWPAGWAAPRPPEPGDELAPSLVVPVAPRVGVDSLRVTLESPPGHRPVLGKLTVDTVWQLPVPDPPERDVLAKRGKFPDDPADTETGYAAGKLTNGLWSDNGWNSGKQVGWALRSGDAKVTIDLGTPHPIDEVVVHTHAASAAGISWPLAPVAVLSTDCAVTTDAAGLIPACQFVGVPGGPAEPTGPLTPSDQAGVVRFRVQPGTTARWLTFAASTHGWLMLDEIEVLSGGRNVGLNAPYHISPPASRPQPDPLPCPELGWWPVNPRTSDHIIRFQTRALPGIERVLPGS